MLVTSLSFVIVAMLIWSPAHPQSASGGTISTAPGKVSMVNAVERTATVVAIDKASRGLTLKGSDGKTMDVTAGEEVRNFEQIRVGDELKVAYMEALTLELKKRRAKTDADTTVVAARAQPGERPAGAVGREVHVIADVVAVDTKQSTVTLKGPKGNLLDIKARDPSHLKNIKVGDQVEGVYTEALAIAITPANTSAGAAAQKPPAK